MTTQGARQQKPLNQTGEAGETSAKENPAKLDITPTKEEAIHQGARLFAEAIRRVVSEGKSTSPITVALSGGSTPKELYLLLTDPEQPYFSQVPWERIHFFWGDERFVPATDRESNFKMAKETLLERLPIRGNYHRIVTENLTPEESAQAYQREIQIFFHLKDLKRSPMFDLILLGLGSNGHTASLFPDTPLEELSSPLYEDCWVKSFYVPELNAMRVSMTPKLINAAREVLFLVTGEDKAEAVWRVLESDELPEKCPAKLIRPESGRMIWNLDEAAAKMLTQK